MHFSLLVSVRFINFLASKVISFLAMASNVVFQEQDAISGVFLAGTMGSS